MHTTIPTTIPTTIATTGNLPTEMPAVGYFASLPASDAQALVDLRLPLPTPGDYDLLVEVKAIAVNPVDTKIRLRRAPAAGQADILGWDAAGVVVATGAKVSRFTVGDAVYYAGDLTRPGSNSQYQLVDERITGHKPASVDFAEAAALPLTAITAWELLFDRLQLQQPSPAHPAPVLLVSGAAGGVGSVLVQLARQLTNAIVIGTASRPESAAWVTQMGAHHVINHQLPLADELARIGVAQVSHVASLVDTGAYYQQFIDALAPQGKLALIDDPAAPLDIRPLKLKSLSLHWELMFTRSMFQTPDLLAQHQLLNEVAALIDAGRLKTTLGSVSGPINAENLRQAHLLQEQGKVIGKQVLVGF